MKFKEKYHISKDFEELFSFKNRQEEIKHEEKMIMFRFLSEVERLSDERKINKKELAEKIGTSASYITQLFRGNKIVNLHTIAKFQKIFNIIFEIKATNNSIDDFVIFDTEKFHEPLIKPDDIKVIQRKVCYSKTENEIKIINTSKGLKIA